MYIFVCVCVCVCVCKDPTKRCMVHSRLSALQLAPKSTVVDYIQLILAIIILGNIFSIVVLKQRFF